jgi:hypothetical protein
MFADGPARGGGNGQLRRSRHPNPVTPSSFRYQDDRRTDTRNVSAVHFSFHGKRDPNEHGEYVFTCEGSERSAMLAVWGLTGLQKHTRSLAPARTPPRQASTSVITLGRSLMRRGMNSGATFVPVNEPHRVACDDFGDSSTCTVLGRAKAPTSPREL